MKEIPIANVYYLLCYAWRWAQQHDGAKLREIEGLSSAQDLLGKILAGGVHNLVRRGIDRGYLERREDLAGIRGKLAVGETAKRALRSRGRAACDFEELSLDILPNQILRTSLVALRRLGRRRGGGRAGTGLDANVYTEVAVACRSLSNISSVPRLERRMFGLVRIDRSRRLYRFLLSVCRLLHEHLFIDEDSGATHFRDFRRNEAEMWRLFETFVTEFYRREQRGFHVNRGGRGIDWWEADAVTDDDRGKIPAMEADLILDGPERRIIMDTKYYAEALGGRHGAGKLHSSNLYQLLAYLRNRQATKPRGARHEGILLYPEVDTPLAADIRLEGFRIQARTIDLSQDWRFIHRDMLRVIE